MGPDIHVFQNLSLLLDPLYPVSSRNQVGFACSSLLSWTIRIVTTLTHSVDMQQPSLPLWPSIWLIDLGAFPATAASSWTETKSRILGTGDTTCDILLLLAGGHALDSVSSAILPPHPRRVRSTGDETQNGGAEVHPARRNIPWSLICDEDVAGDESGSVGNGDKHGTSKGAGVEIWDVGDDPRIVDRRHWICLEHSKSEQASREGQRDEATELYTYSDGGHENGEIRQPNIVQVDRDEQSVADHADDERGDHVHSAFQEVVRRKGRRYQNDGCYQSRCHRILCAAIISHQWTRMQALGDEKTYQVGLDCVVPQPANDDGQEIVVGCLQGRVCDGDDDPDVGMYGSELAHCLPPAKVVLQRLGRFSKDAHLRDILLGLSQKAAAPYIAWYNEEGQYRAEHGQ